MFQVNLAFGMGDQDLVVITKLDLMITISLSFFNSGKFFLLDLTLHRCIVVLYHTGFEFTHIFFNNLMRTIS